MLRVASVGGQTIGAGMHGLGSRLRGNWLALAAELLTSNQRLSEVPMVVKHDRERQRFFMTLADGEAELFYAPFADRILDLQHTEVPRSAQGQGVGDALVRAALVYAREYDFRVIATCPYVQRWLRKHPEERPVGMVDRST